MQSAGAKNLADVKIALLEKKGDYSDAFEELLNYENNNHIFSWIDTTFKKLEAQFE